MSSKREEERNEKIIRGLLKLPPNRRCINCNSLGPQYVCTNFWTFVCTTCSGIHREFTHRVKSVSMAKFTLQEVDALQKGGNQRAREIYLMAWDPQINRLPDNSNVDKVRDFIKNVYVNKKYAVEKSSDKPPKDPQGLRNHEGETRRASSYHSFSQSPPYDFQYEERRYGKHAPALTRKPGSDRGLYDGKLASFLSPTRFGDNANDDRFANEGSNPRASDYSVSSGGDPFRSDVLSPSSQRGLGSPSSETYHTDKHKSDANSRSDGGRAFHPQRSASAGSFGSFDSNSMSFKSVNSTGFPEVASEPEPSAEFSHNEPSSLPSLGQSSVSGTVNGFDPFGASFAPHTITSRPPPGSNSQLLESSPSQSVDLFQQSPISSLSTFTEQQAPPVPQPSSIDLFSTLSQQQSAAASNVVMPENGGWATFDTTQKSTYTENCAPAALPSSEENASGNFNPFSFEQGPSYSTYPEPPASSHTFWHGLQDVDSTTTNTPFWNAFEDSAEQPIQNVLKNSEQAADLSLGFGAYEVLNNQGNINIPDESGPPSSSSLSSHFCMPLHDFSMVPAAAGVHSIATDHKPNNPFDLPYDSDIGSSDNVLWDMNSLHDSLPNAPTSASYVGEVNQSWFLENSVSSYVPGGVTFDHPSGSLGLIAAQTPASQISNIPAQGPVASVGGNPFA